MRILQIANFVHATSGGLMRTMDSLASEYARLGHTVRAVVPGDVTMVAPESQVWQLRGITVPKMAPYRVIIGRRELKTVVEGYSPDYIEISDKTTLTWLAKWAKDRGIHVNVISHERTDIAVRQGGLAGQAVRPYLRWNRRHVRKWADAIVCASSFAAEEFGDAPRVAIVPLGVDIETFRPAPKKSLEGGPAQVVVCSRLSPEKNLHVAVEAIRCLLMSGRNVELTVIGDGPDRDDLVRSARGLPVRFLGYQSDRRVVARLIAASDVLMNLGSQETFGLVTLEALACGTPVVVPDAGASQELVTPEVGSVVSLTPENVAAAIETLLARDSLQMSMECRAFAERYSWQRTAAKLLPPVSRVESLNVA